MTTRTIDTPTSTSWEITPKKTKWIDYLRDETGEIIHDNDLNPICIYSDSGFEEVDRTIWYEDSVNNTTWTID